jgi:cytochrome c
MKTAVLFVLSFVLIFASVALTGCSNAQAATGKQVFQDQCAGCHNSDTDDKKVGPGLKGLFHRDKLVSTGKKVSEATVRAQIDEGGSGMPSFDQLLSDQDKENLIVYLKTL